MKTPTLKDVLWTAQEGRCWICRAHMRKAQHNHAQTASLDHLWPRKQYGAIGDIGITLLAHKRCNEDRGATLPSDDDIRILISVYRLIPAWWLEMASRDAATQARNARAFAVRSDIVATLAAGAA